MNKRDVDFETWFDNLAMHVLERTGVAFRDRDSVLNDYLRGKNMFDVTDEIVAEYSE